MNLSLRPSMNCTAVALDEVNVEASVKGVQYFVVWCSVVQCVTGCCSVLQYFVVCCSVSQCAAVCRSVLQCVAVCCSVAHLVPYNPFDAQLCVQFVAVCCSVLQCVAVRCDMLQYYFTQPLCTVLFSCRYPIS